MLFKFTVKTHKQILDKAFRRAKGITAKSKRLEDQKEKAINKISTVENVITHELEDIVKNMPVYDKLSSFYKELFSTYIDVKRYRKCLYHVSWTGRKVRELSRKTISRIKNAKNKDEVIKYVKSFYGRVSSLIEDLEECLSYLIESSKYLRKFPDIDESKAIFVIAGFPNVGKSSLINVLTKSKVESQPYPFTTKDLLVGKEDYFLIVDTPGILESNLERLNDIEMKGVLALKHLSKYLIFVVDPTYDVEKQKALLESIEQVLKPSNVVVVINKIDLINDFVKLGEYKTFYVSALTKEGIDDLKSFLQKEALRMLGSKLPKMSKQ